MRPLTPRPATLVLSALLQADGDLRLDRGALLIAEDEDPSTDSRAALDALDALADGVHLPEGARVEEQVARLNHRLFIDQGFAGDTESYDDPANSRLDQVLIRKKGLPILLSVLLIEVGRRVGVELLGIGFPGHFLVRPAEASFYLDPFNGGAVLGEDALVGHLARLMGRPPTADEWERAVEPASSRRMLTRMSFNLQQRYVRERDHSGALRQIERLLVLAPEMNELWRDRGLLLLNLDQPRAGRAALEYYLELEPEGRDVVQVRELLEELDA